MRMQKRKFRIGELAQKLSVERFVIRFWEKEFGLKTERSGGGQRFYDETDVSLFEKIKELLYKQGFTIAGAKKRLLQEKTTTRVVGSRKTVLDEPLTDREKQMNQKIQTLQAELVKLRELL